MITIATTLRDIVANYIYTVITLTVWACEDKRNYDLTPEYKED